MKRNFNLTAAAVTACAAMAALAGSKKATLCTTYGDDIYDYQLDQYIDSVIPPSAKRLIVLTQCYGGDCVDNFAGGTNTSVISATSAGQKAKYGGYDDDAANACKPGAGRTGQSVHNDGVAGKHPEETPGTGGGLAPGAVSLEPVTADGPVRSRHVVVYAGMPDAKGRDNAQRDKIKANFAGQPNTTVTTVGGEGPEDGWDKHGWGRGLKDAINEAAAAIEAAPDPSKEQFLLFVTDHGDLHTVEYVTTPVPGSNSVVAHAVAFVTPDFQERLFARPGFSVTVNLAPFTHEVGDPTDYIPFFPTNAWRLRLTPPLPAQPVLLAAFEERFIEVDDGLIGNAPDEGVRLFFPVDPALFVESFFDVAYEVEIFNDTPNPYLVMEFSQDTGPVAKGESEHGFIWIGENTLIGENDMTYEGHEIVVAGCALTIDGVHFFDRLTLENNATVTHAPGSMGLALTVMNDVTVRAGSKIDVSACGLGPKAETTGRSGGSYGGLGQSQYGSACPAYGDAWRPSERGSGGVGPSGRQAVGGGRLQIVSETLMLEGALLADGQSGGEYTGGGSGGAIWLDVGVLSGVGSVRANGGAAGADGGGAGGGGRVAVYARNAEAFSPSALEAKAPAGAGWGSVLFGVPRTVTVSVAGQGACAPAGPVVVPYGGANVFTFSAVPASLKTNGTEVVPAATFEWLNGGLWRGTLDDAAWTARLSGSETLEAAFEALLCGGAAALSGGGMAVSVNGLAGWRYTLERRESLTEGGWVPVPGQAEILCAEAGSLLLTDTAARPRAFYRVVSAP